MPIFFHPVLKILKAIRSPIKKTRQWATRKIREDIREWRHKKTGLGKYDAWMEFGEILIDRKLVPVFRDNVAGIVDDRYLIVNQSEATVHGRSAGAALEAWTVDREHGTAFAVARKPDDTFALVRGTTSEVLTPGLTREMDKLFGPGIATFKPVIETRKVMPIGPDEHKCRHIGNQGFCGYYGIPCVERSAGWGECANSLGVLPKESLIRFPKDEVQLWHEKGCYSAEEYQEYLKERGEMEGAALGMYEKVSGRIRKIKEDIKEGGPIRDRFKKK